MPDDQKCERAGVADGGGLAIVVDFIFFAGGQATKKPPRSREMLSTLFGRGGEIGGIMDSFELIAIDSLKVLDRATKEHQGCAQDGEPYCYCWTCSDKRKLKNRLAVLLQAQNPRWDSRHREPQAVPTAKAPGERRRRMPTDDERKRLVEVETAINAITIDQTAGIAHYPDSWRARCVYLLALVKTAWDERDKAVAAERASLIAAVRIICEAKEWGATPGAVAEDYPELVGLIHNARTTERERGANIADAAIGASRHEIADEIRRPEGAKDGK